MYCTATFGNTNKLQRQQITKFRNTTSDRSPILLKSFYQKKKKIMELTFTDHIAKK